MSIHDWWDAVKELFGKPDQPEQPQRPFLPPHSWPADKAPPTWPKKDERK
jgi:hypothetical protein